mmetsp:Transcript_109558/g.189567  ORF Transcript_109558/g.189567 Transcript_109558/m.189567 type:complete len:218 (+) Transcript_109558:142-795(+)
MPSMSLTWLSCGRAWRCILRTITIQNILTMRPCMTASTLQLMRTTQPSRGRLAWMSPRREAARQARTSLQRRARTKRSERRMKRRIRRKRIRRQRPRIPRAELQTSRPTAAGLQTPRLRLPSLEEMARTSRNPLRRRKPRCSQISCCSAVRLRSLFVRFAKHMSWVVVPSSQTALTYFAGTAWVSGSQLIQTARLGHREPRLLVQSVLCPARCANSR